MSNRTFLAVLIVSLLGFLFVFNSYIVNLFKSGTSYRIQQSQTASGLGAVMENTKPVSDSDPQNQKEYKENKKSWHVSLVKMGEQIPDVLVNISPDM